MKPKENEEGAKIPFINILKFIECGETANVTINGKQFKISVNTNDEKYYIEEESFKNREEFIHGLYNKTSIKLSENSIVILNSIADGTVKVDSSWKFEDKNKGQVNVETNKKYKLHRNIVIKLSVLYVFILSMIYIFFKEISMCTEANLYITFYKNRILREEWFTISKEIIAVLLIINTISIAFFKENRIRLITLFKYSKEHINKIEEKIIKYKDENVVFGGKYDICFSKTSLILMRKVDFRIINYQDIVCVLNIRDYLLEKEREICIITKDKKIIRLGNVVHREELKKRLIEKNPKIIFKKSKNINKNEIIDLDEININNILLKDIVTTCYKIWSKVIAIYPALYYILNHNLLKDTLTAHKIVTFIIGSFFAFLIYCCIIYNSSKIKKQ